MILGEVAGLNSKLWICFLMDLQPVFVKMSPLFIINTKTSQLNSLTWSHIPSPQSSGFILILTYWYVDCYTFLSFSHGTVVYIVKDIHKSLCLQKGREIWYAHDLSPINDMGENRFGNCSCHHFRNKTNKESMTFSSCLMHSSLS